MVGVHLHDDTFRELAVGGGVARTGGQRDFPFRSDVRHFNDGGFYGGDVAVAHVHGRMGQVHVVVAGAAAVDVFAQGGGGLVGRAAVHGVRFRQGAVRGGAGGGSRKDVYLEGTARFMFRDCPGGNGAGDRLGYSGGGETAEADIFTMFNESCCFFWCQFLVTHVS